MDRGFLTSHSWPRGIGCNISAAHSLPLTLQEDVVLLAVMCQQTAQLRAGLTPIRDTSTPLVLS